MLSSRLPEPKHYEIWVENYYSARDFILKLPFPARFLLALLISVLIRLNLYTQGTGRFSKEEIRGFRNEIWEGVNVLLEDSRRKHGGGGEQPYWLHGGEKPTEVDLTVFGFMVSALIGPV